jgi:tetratricopeptide (TPR) repeat protein
MDFLRKQAEEAEDAGNLAKALELWRELAGRGREAVAFLRYGSVAQKLGGWQEAEIAFTQALQLDQTSSLAMENMGSLWACRRDKNEADSFQTAKRWFLKALKFERHARLLTQLGATYLALDDNSAARDAFEEAIRTDPEYEEALYNLALVEEQSNPRKSSIVGACNSNRSPLRAGPSSTWQALPKGARPNPGRVPLSTKLGVRSCRLLVQPIPSQSLRSARKKHRSGTDIQICDKPASGNPRRGRHICVLPGIDREARRGGEGACKMTAIRIPLERSFAHVVE